jgi:formate/nitrite transporter FocA (FNT family)
MGERMHDGDGRQDEEQERQDGGAKLEAEQEEAEQRSAPTPSVVWQAVYAEGRDELQRGPKQLAWSALAAGLSMGFSLIGEGLLRRYLPAAEWRPLVSKLGYAMGFLVVVLGRQQLFTENTLTVMLPLLHHKTWREVAKVLRLWAVVFAGNLVGALAVGWVLGHTAVFDERVQQTFAAVAMEGSGAAFGTVLLRGVFAGWLIALMVWLMPGAETARIWIIILVTYLIALGGFAHVIAGSVDKLFLVTTGQMSLGTYLGGFLAPSFVGNVIGGVSLVAALNHVAAAPTHVPGE